jgi:enoyl-CoA hydratase
MLCVVLEQIRRARSLTLAEDLRMERNMVRHCFHHRPVADSETVEGIRALAVDKDKQPKWKPQQVSEVDAAEVESFFNQAWPAHAHPLRGLT